MKILFLDSWVKGIHNFLPLAKKISDYGVETLLVHKGSWGAEPDRALEEIIDGLMCRDIRYYQTRLLYKMLQKEKPNVVLMLTTNYIADRTAILACRSLGIKSVFLMHGIRQIDSDDVIKSEISIRGEMRKLRWQRAFKYLQYTIPNYYYSGYKEDRLFFIRKNGYRVLINTFLYPEKWTLNPLPSRELQCDKALVWANIYKRFFMQQYGYPEKNVEVVGHPPLDEVFQIIPQKTSQNEKRDFLRSIDIEEHKPYVVYLEDGFVETGFNGWTHESRLNHLEEIAKICSHSGKSLVIKLHPVTEFSEIIESRFKDSPSVKVIRKINLPLLLFFCESGMGHISSTLNILLALKKPVFVPTWGISRDLPNSFIQAGVAIPCVSPEEMCSKLSNPVADLEKTRATSSQYIEDYITWTDGKSVDRIVNALFRLK